MSKWRDIAKPIIEKVISENYDKTDDEIRVILRSLYPFGERKYHPYYIWIDEIKKQLHMRYMNQNQGNLFDQNQNTLFDQARFNGSDYEPEHDDIRLRGQIRDIYRLMKDQKWRTLSEIETQTGHGAASISAQLRHLRKKRFGEHTVNKRSRGDRKHGLWEYQLILNETLKITEDEQIRRSKKIDQKDL